MRRTDTLTIRSMLLLMAALSIFAVVVQAQYRQPAVVDASNDPITVAVTASTVASHERRIEVLESARMDQNLRLGILEDVAKRTGELRMLAYGTIATLLGNMALFLWTIKAAPRNRNVSLR